MKKTNIYFIEDNLSYRSLLIKRIQHHMNKEKINSNFEIIEITNFLQFYINIEQQDIQNNDIFLIDIQLNTYFNGINLGKLIRQKNNLCKIIFLTAFTDKAIEVLNSSIFPEAYIIKSDNSDITSLQIVDLLKISFLDSITNKQQLCLITSGNIEYITNYEDIIYITTINGCKNQLLVKTINSDIIVNGSLKKFKKKLSSPPFILFLKSYIINSLNIKIISKPTSTIYFTDNSILHFNSQLIKKISKIMKDQIQCQIL